MDCYTSDITRTAPTGNSGKFTKEGKGVYEVVLKMQDVRSPLLGLRIIAYGDLRLRRKRWL